MSMADRIDRALDAALDMTFPASDPIAIRMPEARVASAPTESRLGRANSAISPRTGVGDAV
jgi:hypothetical protein